MKKEIDRIKYNVWSSWHLSVARFYWGIKIWWNYYEYDKEVVKQMMQDKKNWVSEEKLYKPDLVLYGK